MRMEILLTGITVITAILILLPTKTRLVNAATALIGNVELNYKITNDLSANLRTGNDYYTDRRKLKIAYGTSGTPFGSYEEDAYTINENNTEARLDFNKKINSDFSLNILGGGNIRTARL